MFGKGKIEVSISKTHFAPGEVISGTVRLNLKKAVRAKSVSVSLIGDQKTVQTSGMIGRGDAGSSTSHESRRVYDFKQELDGEKEYTGGEYSFEIGIPADILGASPSAMPDVGPAVGASLKMASQLLGGASTRVKWYLRAKLDVPHGIDVKKDVDITIG